MAPLPGKLPPAKPCALGKPSLLPDSGSTLHLTWSCDSFQEEAKVEFFSVGALPFFLPCLLHGILLESFRGGDHSYGDGMYGSLPGWYSPSFTLFCLRNSQLPGKIVQTLSTKKPG